MFDIPSSEHLKLTEPIKGFILNSESDLSENDLNKLRTLISEAENHLNVSVDQLYIKDENRNYYTPAQYACFKNNPKLLEFFIEQGAKIRNIDSLPYYKPFFHSARKGDAEITKVLLNNGYGVNEKDMHDCTALVYAARSNKEEVVNVLLNPDYGCDVNHQDRGGNTALSYAARNGNEKIVKRLIEQSGIDINLPNIKEINPLMYAVENDYVKILELLLNSENIRVNEKDTIGFTALHLAVKQRNIEAVKLLLGRDDIDCNIKDMDGYTPLDYAVNEDEIVELLEDKKFFTSIETQVEEYLDLLKDYLNQKRYQAVINVFEEKISSNSLDKFGDVFNREISLCLGKAYYFLKKYPKATKYLSLGLKFTESQHDLTEELKVIIDELNFYKGKSLYILKKYNAAIHDFNEISDDSTFYAEAQLYRGFCYENQKRVNYHGAKICFESAIDSCNEQNEVKSMAVIALTKNLILQGKSKEALDFFKKIDLKINDFDSIGNTLLMYASIYHKKDVAAFLIHEKADPSRTNIYGFSAQSIAEENEDSELLGLFNN